MWLFFPRGATVSEISGKKAPQKIPSYPMGGFSDTHTQTYTVAHRTQKQTHGHKHTHRCTHRGRHMLRAHRNHPSMQTCVLMTGLCVCELSRPWKSSKQKKLSFSHLEASKISKTPPISHTNQTFRKTCGSAGRTWIGAFSQKITAVSEKFQKNTPNS